MKTLNEIRDILSRNKKELETIFNLGIQELAIFGSYARNEQGQESDIDILIDFKEPIGLLKFIELERHLSDLLGAKVDLVTRKALKPKIGKQILRELVGI
mgnify:CR=1 FL=1